MLIIQGRKNARVSKEEQRFNQELEKKEEKISSMSKNLNFLKLEKSWLQKTIDTLERYDHFVFFQNLTLSYICIIIFLSQPDSVSAETAKEMENEFEQRLHDLEQQMHAEKDKYEEQIQTLQSQNEDISSQLKINLTLLAKLEIDNKNLVTLFIYIFCVFQPKTTFF